MTLSATKELDQSSLALLQDYLNADMGHVDRVITERLNSSIPLIPTLGLHLIQAGGKRLRPLLTLAAHRLFVNSSPSAYLLASAVEFIHTATLLHDDVVDDSKTRRGQNTANEIWGNQSSVLVGDFLFAKAFELMVETHSFEVLTTLSKASARIAEGEVLQLSLCHDFSLELNDLLTVISAKTAELFGAACKVGAIIAHQDQSMVNALYGFGHDLGMAFQIIDDILDYSANTKALGKTVGDDFREGKITLPVFLSYQRSDSQGRAFWQRVFSASERFDLDLHKAQDLIVKSGGISTAMTMAQEYGRSAQKHLKRLPNHLIREYFHNLIDELLVRKF